MALINSTILSGSDAIKALTPVVADKQHLLVLTDKNIVNLPATTQIMTLLSQDGRHVKLIDDVPAEPTHTDVEAVLSRTAGKTFDLVVGIGGGSVLDVAKLLSVLCHVASPPLRRCLMA